MKKKLNIPKEFWKDFKDRKDFDEFFSELFKEGISQMLNAEMTDHLGYEKHSKEGENSGNSRNGDYPKTLKTNLGEITVNIPRDRNGEYDPKVIPKHESRLSDEIAQVIIGLYSRGMSTTDIQQQVEQIYGVQVDSTSVSNITNVLTESIKEWQNRPLEEVYFVVWMDGISIKIRHNGKIINKTIYLVIGLTQEGMKQVLGMWVAPTESASFWMSVLTDLKARGVEDILIASTDNLAGFTDAIKSVFPLTVTQLCVVHQVRNSLRYVVWKEKKEFTADMKQIYHAATIEAAEQALENFEKKWGQKYAYAVKSWKNNWENLTQFFEYPLEIRKIVYTTNIIESLNRGIRKYTKTKSMFPHDQAALKAVYLAIGNIENKWTMPIRNWGMILQQFLIKFEERCRI
ncbi:MAG: IS256 family transposase [Bacteroidetes bacterium]|nr:IS256 family transposase [Bacteroidota bacterium]